MKFCSNCGTALDDAASFCGQCGHKVQLTSSNGQTDSTTASGTFVNTLNDYIGNTNTVKMNWKALFSEVFKSHTTQEAEDIFICGTSRTTPSLKEVSEAWPKPWLYSRVFLCFVATFILLNICSSIFNNSNAYPGLIIIGAFAVPFTTLVMFLEINVFRNISLYEVMKLFLVGGCASLVVTLFLFDLELVNTDLSSSWGALMVGIIEEIGKLVIVYLLVKKIPSCNYILSALLAGACVGAGFAAFESAGYAMLPMLKIANMAGANGMETPVTEMMDIVSEITYLRAILAPGGHVAWAAVSGAALILAKNGAPLTTDVFKSIRFWKIFSIPVLLHALWDAPILENSSTMKYSALVVMVWIVVLILTNMGLDEVKLLKNNTK